MTMKETLHALEEVKQAIELAYSSGYSAAKQQRPWVGLTDGEIKATAEIQGMNDRITFARAIEARLKERNT
jgi:hypothetical protein